MIEIRKIKSDRYVRRRQSGGVSEAEFWRSPSGGINQEECIRPS